MKKTVLCFIYIILVFLSKQIYAEILVVTHGSKNYDFDSSAEKGIKKVHSYFLKKNTKPKIFHILDKNYDKKPSDYYVWPQSHFENSQVGINGEHHIFPEPGERIVLVGGYFHGCLTGTINSFIENFYSKNSTSLPLNIELYTPGVYSFRYNHFFSFRNDSLNLKKVLHKLKHDIVAQTFYNNSYGIQEYGDALQNARTSPKNHLGRLKNHRLILKIDGEFLDEFGEAKNPVITLNLIDTLK